MPNFSGIWTRSQQMQARGASTWPATPGAPTIGAATAGNSLCASVTFTAPSCTGYPLLTTYRVTSTPGCFTNTGASSPIVVSGLTAATSYTFKVAATNTVGYGPCSAASNSITAVSAGSQSYTTAGTYSWVAPANVTSVSVVAVGAGGSSLQNCYSGGGGGLGYKNNYAVTPGNSYTVVVGSPVLGSNPAPGNSYFVNTSVVRGGGGSFSSTGGTYTGDGGGNGGGGCGSGGAGGYAGNGGNGTFAGGAGTSGAGGGGGGGGSTSNTPYRSAGGGGVGLLGQGSNGAGGSGGTSTANGGGGGSGGTSGGAANASIGGDYGGGAGRCSSANRCGGKGAVRIIWPGSTRSFPSTNAGNP